MPQKDEDFSVPSPFYRVSLKAIVLNNNQQLLVIKDSDGNWELPGGGWEYGESMQNCLRREIMEELGVGVQHIDFSTIYPYSSIGRTGNARLKLAIPVTLSSYKFNLDNEEDIVDYKFISAQELASLDMLDVEAGIKTHISRIWP